LEEYYYAILSGEHPCMPLEELRAILDAEASHYKIHAVHDGIAIFTASIMNPSIIAERAGWVREVGVVLGVVESTIIGIRRLARDSSRKLGTDTVWVDPWRFKGYSPHAREDLVRKIFVEELRRAGIIHARKGRTLRIFITEGIAVAGITLGTRLKGFHLRRPRRRPFFKPGPLSPELSRVLVNLSRLRRGSTFLDPFCGTGGFALEAMLIGAGKVLCGDIDASMVEGSSINLRRYGCGSCVVFRHNAVKLPLGDEVVEAIATDPPYGRSTTTSRMGYRGLITGFLPEAYRVLKRGGYLVFAGPYTEGPWRLAEDAGFRVRSRFHMYVHSSLTREVVVASKE